MFNLGKTKSLIGLDIGSSSVKAVELKKAKDGYELVSFGLEPLAQDTVVDGAIMDAPSVAEKIIAIFDAQKIKIKDVATSVSGHSVIVKRVSMPLMTEEELYDRIQAEEITPFLKGKKKKKRGRGPPFPGPRGFEKGVILPVMAKKGLYHGFKGE